MVLVGMREANKPIDLISLTQLLEDRHLLEDDWRSGRGHRLVHIRSDSEQRGVLY